MDVEHPPGGKYWLDPHQKTFRVSLRPTGILQSLIHVTCKSLEYRQDLEPLEETNAVTAEHTTLHSDVHTNM